MSPRYVALLRGINVGGHRVEMKRLRALFEAMGLGDVSTFIASGNVLFSTESSDVEGLRIDIERRLERDLGYEVATFLRTTEELEAIAAAGPSGEQDVASGAAHYVMFLHDPAPEWLRSELAALASERDRFEWSGREIHWRMSGRLSESPLFGGGIERVTRRIPTTMRNINTLRRMVAKTRGLEGS